MSYPPPEEARFRAFAELSLLMIYIVFDSAVRFSFGGYPRAKPVGNPCSCLKESKTESCSPNQGGCQCSDRRALCWRTPNKRSALGRWIRHRDLGRDPAAFQSLCAVHYRGSLWIGVRLLRSFSPRLRPARSACGRLGRGVPCFCPCSSNDLCEAKSSEYTCNQVAQRS